MSNVHNPSKPNQGNNQGNSQGSQNRPGQGNSFGQSHQSGGTATMDKGADKSKEKENESHGVAGAVSDAASYIGEKAKAATSSVMGSAGDAASYVGKKTDDGIHAVGSSLKSFGDTVRSSAPGSDMLKGGMCAVADTLENTGKYLEEGGLANMAEDVTGLIKRNPIPALFVGIGVGFLLARALTPRS